MSDSVSWNQMTGLSGSATATPTVPEVPAGVSWEQMGGQAPAPSLWDRAKDAYRKVSESLAPVEAKSSDGLTQVGQEAKALVNMGVGIPGGVAGVGMDVASRTSDLLRGVPAKQAGQNARAVAEQTNADWGKVTSMLGLQQDATGSKIDALMTKGIELSDVAGAKAEAATGGVISQETMQSVRDTLLNSLGVKGLGKVPKARGNAAREALTADQAIRDSKARIAQAALDKQIAEVAAGTAKAAAVDAVVKEALAKRHPLDEAFAKKKAEPEPGSSPQWDTMVRGLVEPPKMEAPQGPGLTPKTRLAEPVVIGEVPDLLESGIAKLRKGELISAKEAKAIRQLKPLAGQEALVGPDGKSYYQRGAADPALLKVLGLMGLGAVAGTALYNWFQSPSELPADNARDVSLGLAGLGAAGMLKGKFEGVPQPELLSVLRQGGREAEGAAARLYEDTHRQLARSITQMGQNLPVEDIMQRTYEKAFRALKLPPEDPRAFRGDAQVSTFLHAIAKNEARNAWAAEKVRPQTESMSVDPETGGTSAPESYTMAQSPEKYRSAQDETATNQLAQKMQAALGKLPPDQRAVFDALELEGLSYEEAAVSLNVPIGTIRSRFSRAKENLQGALREYNTPGKEGHLQAGKIDQKLLTGVGVTAGGALVGSQFSDDPANGAIIGGMLALGGLGFGSKPVDMAIGRTTTRIANIAPTFRRAIRDMEHAASVEISRASDVITSFTKPVKKLAPAARVALDEAYYTADGAKMKELVKQSPELAAGYAKVRSFLTEVEGTLKGLGRFQEGVPDYIPLLVKDYKGLMATLGREVKEGLLDYLHKANVKMSKEKGRELTETERSLLTNDYLLRDPATSYQPGYAKSRRLKVTAETRPFYHTMEDALIHYGHAAVSDVQTAAFFGKDLVASKVPSGQKYTNVKASIGARVNRLLDSKEITPEQAAELKAMLRARFVGGEKSPAPLLQDVRNLSGAALLGQIGSGLIQTSEALLSAYHHGIMPAVDALGMVLTRRGIKPFEFGLANHVIEEVIGKRPSGQLLSALLKVNLLATLDQVGISQNLTASFIKNKRLAETPAGIAKLTEKWGADYGPDLPQLVKELKSSTRTERTPLVDSLLYQELSDVRPTSRSEAPQLYNAHPNARLAYHLKQFMITQADVIRRDSWNKIKTGDPKQVAVGLKNLALYAAALSVVTIPSDAIKNWIMGRPLNLDKIDYVENFTRNFGLSRYTMNQTARNEAPGKSIVKAAESMVTPPVVSVAETLGEGMSNPKKLVPFIPFGGRIVYNRALGGNVKAREAQALQDRLDKRDAMESRNPALKVQRLRKEELRQKKREAKLRSAQ